MAKLPTFTKWSMAFVNFICHMTFRDFIKSNSRGLIGGTIGSTIFVCVYVILPMFYSSLDGSMWTGKYAYNWLLGIYPALIILGFLCTKPTQSANGGESATSGFKLGIIPTLPLLV